MGRRSDHTRDELYDMAMEKSRSIVAKEGWRKLTARTLAKEMGYSVGTLYNLFGNLDDLILHLNANTLEGLRVEMAEVPLKGEPNKDMAALLKVYLSYVAQNAHMWAVLFEHSLPEDQELPDWYLNKVGELLGLVEEAISPFFKNGQESARKENAATIWAGLHGIGSLAGMNKLDAVTESTQEELARNFINVFLKGLK